jgi:hypothetical protein
MPKTVAIVQSNYIPWKGYFDLIHQVDEFILYDDMQYTRRDWRNRNKIKTAQGLVWLTVPVETKGNYYQPIKDVVVSTPQWKIDHWKTLQHTFARAPYFKAYSEFFEELYLNTHEKYLSQINYHFLSAICRLLKIDTTISWSMDYEVVEGKTERLVSLCQQAGATRYLSGPSARDYMQPELFAQAGIELSYMDYTGYPEYMQPFPPFEHGVTILDLIFNVGESAPQYMKSFA